jgi:hypothetical protein
VTSLRGVVLAGWLFELGCASAPLPKAPDETRRVPVNKVVPPEVGGRAPRPEEPSDAEGRGAEVEWR